MNEKVGKNIKKLREKLGETQQEFAEKLGLEDTTIGRLELQKRKPSYRFMKAFNERFPEISMNEFFFGGDEDA